LVYGRFAFAALLALVFGMAHDSSTAYAKKKKAPSYGTIKIRSNPADLPLEVDGKPYVTTADYTIIERLEPGQHTIVVTLPDGQKWRREIDLPAGRIKCISLDYRPTLRPVISPCPFPVRLSAPSQLSEGEVITYSAQAPYAGSSPLIYTWTVTPAGARILSGSGTPKIEVDSTGLAGQRITATVVVDDGSGNLSCRQTAQASSFIPPQEKRVERVAKEFDVCSSCSYDDQKARLDNAAIELQNDPSSTTYLIAYGGRARRAGQAQRLLDRARDYLVTQRGIDPSRIVLINGGISDEDRVEIWIVPQGATPPQARPSR